MLKSFYVTTIWCLKLKCNCKIDNLQPEQLRLLIIGVTSTRFVTEFQADKIIT